MRGSGWARVAARRRPVLGAGGSRVSAGACSPKPGSPGEADSRSCWLCAWRTVGAFGLPPGGAAGLRGRVGAVRRVSRMSNPSAFGLNAGSGLGCRRVCRWGGGGPWWEVQFASSELGALGATKGTSLPFRSACCAGGGAPAVSRFGPCAPPSAGGGGRPHCAARLAAASSNVLEMQMHPQLRPLCGCPPSPVGVREVLGLGAGFS